MAEKAIKVRIFGKDFWPIKEFGIQRDDKESVTGIDVSDFVTQFADKHEDKNLLLPTNRKFSNKWVGGIRDKNFEYNGKVYDLTVQLRCRLDYNDKAYFLATMLFSKDKEIEFNNKADLSFNSIFDILLLFRYTELLRTVSKKGIFRQYRRFEKNDDRPRGVLDISRHIRLNGDMNNGRIAYSYREHTSDNALNRLIIAAYRKLKMKFRSKVCGLIDKDAVLHSMLGAIEQSIGYSNMSVRKIVSQNLKPVTHPYFHEYEGLRRVCLKILRDEDLSIFDADCSEECEAFLEDITRLWEEYIEDMMTPLLGEFGLEMEAQAERKYWMKEISKPDFILWRGDIPLAILDAKFKPEYWNNAFNGEHDDYIREDINKCIRDMVVLNTAHTGVIFPVLESAENAYTSEPDSVFKSDVIKAENKNARKVHAPVTVYGFNAARMLFPKSFNMTRVLVPEFGEKRFVDWQEEMNERTREILRVYLRQLVGESVDIKREA